MKISSYSIVYSGMGEPAFAAVADGGQPLWAAASGNQTGSAAAVIRTLKEAASRFPALTQQNLEAAFTQSQINQSLQRMNAEVSVAGMALENGRAHMFNIGNARIFKFAHGYLDMHSDDHSEAYEAYLKTSTRTLSAYDRIRYMNSRMTLRRALGTANNAMQFYTPAQLNRDDAFLICTERFWRFISVIEMELDYRKSAGPEEWLKTMGRRVLMKANRELDENNFAAVAAIVEE